MNRQGNPKSVPPVHTPRDEGRARLFQDRLLSLNLGFGVSYALFAYVGGSYIAIHAPNGVRDFLDAFAGMLVRIAPLTVHLRSRTQLVRSEIIREVVFLSLVLGVALFAYLLMRTLTRFAGGGLIEIAAFGLAALVAVPGCWLYIVHATWNRYDAGTFWGSFGLIFLLEAAAAGVLVYIFRNQAVWQGTLVFVLHYLFWIFLVVRQGRVLAAITLAVPISLVSPCSGYAWLRYVRGSRLRSRLIA
jgi:hypothetical protein